MDVTRSDLLNALAMAVLFGFVIALVVTIFGNPAVGAGIAAPIGSFLCPGPRRRFIPARTFRGTTFWVL